MFTEHGAVMATNVLSNQIAIHASILIVRTFIRVRTMLADNGELKTASCKTWRSSSPRASRNASRSYKRFDFDSHNFRSQPSKRKGGLGSRGMAVSGPRRNKAQPQITYADRSAACESRDWLSVSSLFAYFLRNSVLTPKKKQDAMPRKNQS
jgi:hypothetical protein